MVKKKTKDKSKIEVVKEAKAEKSKKTVEVEDACKCEGKDVEETSEIEKLKIELAEKTEIAKESHNNLLRFKADYENYKKRISKEQSDFYKYANEKLIGDLLPVVDNLERALTSSEKSQDNGKALKEGVEITFKELFSVLKNAGLEHIESLKKPFDPMKHEALTQVENDEYDANTVIEEFQKGYSFKDKVLRHSKVVVSKKPASVEEDAKVES